MTETIVDRQVIVLAFCWDTLITLNGFIQCCILLYLSLPSFFLFALGPTHKHPPTRYPDPLPPSSLPTARSSTFHRPLLAALSQAYAVAQTLPAPRVPLPSPRHLAELHRRLPWTLIELAATMAQRAHQELLAADQRGVFSEAANASRTRAALTAEASRAFPVMYLAESLARELLADGLVVARPVVQPVRAGGAANLPLWQRVRWEPLYTADAPTRQAQLRRGLQDLQRRLPAPRDVVLPMTITPTTADDSLRRTTAAAAAAATTPASAPRLNLRTGGLRTPPTSTATTLGKQPKPPSSPLPALHSQRSSMRGPRPPPLNSLPGTVSSSHTLPTASPALDAALPAHPLLDRSVHPQAAPAAMRVRPRSAQALLVSAHSGASRLVAASAVTLFQDAGLTAPRCLSAPPVLGGRMAAHTASATDMLPSPRASGTFTSADAAAAARAAGRSPPPTPPTPPAPEQLLLRSATSLLAARETERREAKLHRAPALRPPSPETHLAARDALAAELLARYAPQREDVGGLDPLLQAVTRAPRRPIQKPGAAGVTPAPVSTDTAADEAPPGTTRYLLGHTAPRTAALAAYTADTPLPAGNNDSALLTPELRASMPQVADRQPASGTTVQLAAPLFLEIDPLVDPREWQRMDAPLQLTEELTRVYGLLSQDLRLDHLVPPAPAPPIDLLHLPAEHAVLLPPDVHLSPEDDKTAMLEALRLCTTATAAGNRKGAESGAHTAEDAVLPAVINATLWRAARTVATRSAAVDAATNGDGRRLSLPLQPITEASVDGPAPSPVALVAGRSETYLDSPADLAAATTATAAEEPSLAATGGSSVGEWEKGWDMEKREEDMGGE